MALAGRLGVGKPILVSANASPQQIWPRGCSVLGFLPLSGITLSLACYDNAAGDTSNQIFGGLGLTVGNGFMECPMDISNGLVLTLVAGAMLVFIA